MNTEHIEKFVNAIACDLEEGGFRQVSGTTLRRTLAIAVSAALPLLADTGIPASQPAELAEQQGDVREQFEAWAKSYGHDLTRRPIGREGDDSYSDDFALYAWTAWQAALAATGKQQVGEVQGDARAQFEAWWKRENYNRGALNSWHGSGYNNVGVNAAWASWNSAIAARQPYGEDSCGDADTELQFYREEVLNLPNILIGAGVFSVDHDGDYKAAWANIIAGIERLAARQTVEPEENVAADTYWTVAEMIEPYVRREGLNPDGTLPASVHDSVAILLEHWVKTRQPVAQVPVCFIPPKDAELLRRREFTLRSMCSAWELPTYENNWVGVYLAAPPAQAVDMGQFNALAALANAIVHHRGESPMKNGVFSEAERLLALIDQSDAAPGVE